MLQANRKKKEIIIFPIGIFYCIPCMLFGENLFWTYKMLTGSYFHVLPCLWNTYWTICHILLFPGSFQWGWLSCNNSWLRKLYCCPCLKKFPLDFHCESKQSCWPFMWCHPSFFNPVSITVRHFNRAGEWAVSKQVLLAILACASFLSMSTECQRTSF